MSLSGSQVAIASGVALTAAVTGVAMLVAGSQGAAPGAAEAFPRWTPETERETLESLALDWEPPKGKTLLLRQTRNDVATALHRAMLARNADQGRADTARLAQMRAACAARLAPFKTRDALMEEEASAAAAAATAAATAAAATAAAAAAGASAAGRNPRKGCAACHQPIAPGGRFFRQAAHDVCHACATNCFACGGCFGDGEDCVGGRFQLTLAAIDAKGAPGDASSGSSRSTRLPGGPAPPPEPEAMVCRECAHLFQRMRCTECRRAADVVYGGKCRECSSFVCVGCKKIIAETRVMTHSADDEEYREHWCEVCYTRAEAAGLRCHCCRRMDFELHGELQLRPLHQSAAEICPTGEYDNNGGGAALGRLVCLDCAHPDQQLVVTTEQAEKLWRESVLPYFATKGLEIPGGVLERLQILLVDSAEMDRLAAGDPHHCPGRGGRGGSGGSGSSGGSGRGTAAAGGGGGAPSRRREAGTSTLGLTLSKTTTETVHTVNLQNGKMVRGSQSLQGSSAAAAAAGDKLTTTTSSTTTITTHTHAVDAVVLLYGLPLVAAGEVLAHEFVHAYHVLYDKRASPADPSKAMPKAVSEGTAQLGAYHWLRDCVRNPRFLSLQRMRLRNIETHSDPNYGEGFLRAREAFDRVTANRWWVLSGAPFNKLFQHVAEVGQLP